MKNKFHSESGQALILIALAAIGLFAMVGLAIDGSAIFSDRRHAQNAADTAALAGALAKVNSHRNADDNATTWAKIVIAANDRANSNGYGVDISKSTVEVYSPPTSGIYSNCSDVHFDCKDYVQVIINSNIKTTIGQVIGVEKLYNRVEAVAKTIREDDNFNFGGNAIVALAPDGCALKAGGTTSVVVNGGGMLSNSASNCAFHKTSCSGLVDINDANGNQGTVSMVGGAQLNSNCMPQADVAPGSIKQIEFPPPYQELDEPSQCSTAGTIISWDASTDTTVLGPGYFDQIPGNGNKWKNNIVLNPGVYCIGTSMRTNNNEVLKVAGTFGVDPGVFLYFKPGGYFTFNGGSGVQLWGINSASLTLDPNLAVYKGFLMYIAPNYASGSPVNCTINGHSGSPYDAFMGTIYAPYCNVSINGSSNTGAFQTQIIGYTVDLLGASGVTLDYNSSNNAVFPISNQVGLSK